MHSCLLLFHQINKKMFYNKLSYNMLTLFSSRDSGDLKRASGDPALAKILIKYYLSYLFFNFISNVVIEYLLTELYVSIFLLTPILEQGILKLEVYGDLVINSKEF